MKFNEINNKDWRTSLAGRSLLTRSQKSVAPEQGLKSRKFGGTTLASGDKILLSKQTKSLMQDLTNMLGLNFHFQS